MQKIKVAINGFGRIGRGFFRVAIERPEIEIVAINDLTDHENLLYLLKYDTAQGKANFDIEYKKSNGKSYFVIGDKHIQLLNERDPSKLPWKSLEIDIAVEATGVFASFLKSQAHLEAGAKRVVVTAPIKDEPVGGIIGATVLMGINQEKLKTCDISSNASCTTNAGGPLISILDEGIGIEKAMLNTIHGYTASQGLVDGPHRKDPRRGRAGAQNIVPSTTGAASATTKALPYLQDKFDGIAIRVPVITGSIIDVTFISKRNTTVEEINNILRNAAKKEKWKKIFDVTEEPIVSSDIIGNSHASIADLNFTRVVDGNLVKVLSWYDNEMGYVHTLVNHVITSGEYSKLEK